VAPSIAPWHLREVVTVAAILGAAMELVAVAVLPTGGEVLHHPHTRVGMALDVAVADVMQRVLNARPVKRNH